MSSEPHFLSLQDTLYVDDDAPADPGPGDPTVNDPNADGTSEHPIESIQDALDVAGQETTIIVRPGTYRENVNLSGKKITLMAVDPLNPHAGPCAVIEGTGDRPVVQIGSGAGPGAACPASSSRKAGATSPAGSTAPAPVPG